MQSRTQRTLCRRIDEYSVVYIPAGRSMLTLLSQRLNYIYTTMEASQRRTLDYCTQDYIERILRIKAEFTDGLEGIFAYESTRNKLPKEIMHMALHLIDKVLRGRYKFNSGEERIELPSDRYVKINFASSGQQESVWILNPIQNERIDEISQVINREFDALFALQIENTPDQHASHSRYQIS